METACFVKGKHERGDAIRAVKDDLAAQYADQLADDKQMKLFNALLRRWNTKFSVPLF